MKPACIDVIHHSTHGAWKQADASDVDALDSCNICFPDGVDVASEDLLVSQCDGSRLHRSQDTGDVDFGAVYGDIETNATTQQLLQMDPSEIGTGQSRNGGDA